MDFHEFGVSVLGVPEQILNCPICVIRTGLLFHEPPPQIAQILKSPDEIHLHKLFISSAFIVSDSDSSDDFNIRETFPRFGL